MATLQQIRTKLRSLISQTDENDSDYTNSELNGLINEAVLFFATLIKFPRDTAEIQVEKGVDTYTLPDDYVIVNNVFFGDKSIKDDVREIVMLPYQQFFDLVPNWMDTDVSAEDRPDKCTLIDRQSIMIKPTPNTEHSASGKKLYIYYLYNPATMTADGDEPDLPPAYHDLIPLYSSAICFQGKLKQPDLAKRYKDEALEKVKLLEPIVNKEFEHQFFSWSSEWYDMGGDFASPVADRRLRGV